MNFCIMHIFWMCNGLSITANGSRLIIVSKSVQWLNGGKVTWMWHPIG
jgi:Fe-S cluster assembly iron-binding protein IscA